MVGSVGGSTGWYDVVLVQGVSAFEVEEAVDGVNAGDDGWQW